MQDRLLVTTIEEFLPTEPAQTELVPKLALRDLGRLARTCKSIHRLFQDTLLLERLAHFLIVSPSVVEVIQMVRAYPELLDSNLPKITNRKGQVIINNKPFSLAFGAGDDEMCAALKEEMISFYGSKETAETEIQKQLSEKIGETDKEQDDLIRNELDALLTAVIQAITNEQFNLGRDADNKLILSPATLAAIATFREGLAALHSKIINKGMHFRSNTLQETYDAYAQAAAQWGYDYNRCALFEDGALTSVLFNVPENDAQRFSQGLYYLQKAQPEKFERKLTLRCTNLNFYDCLRSVSLDFSNLVGRCVDIYCGGAMVSPLRPRAWPRAGLQNLCRTKTSNLQNLRSRWELRPAQ